MADGGKVIIKIDGDDSGFKKATSGLGKFASGALKGVAVGAAAVGTAIVGIGTASIKAYAEFEQLAGGMEKIFNETDTSKIMEDANKAYLDLGLSASQYLAVINDTGAAFASTMGDQKGYEVARQGLQAISDYASGTGKNVDELSEKFGMITRSTSSYQSIADQFSGILPATSQGFLEQAQAAGVLSGEYSKLTDVPIEEYQAAVSAMLEKGVTDLGLYGNTAAEATTTISGSFGMLKASWENLITGIANPDADLANLIQQMMESVGAVISNVLPVISTALPNIVAAFSQLIPELASTVSQLLPTLLPIVVDLIVSLATAIIENLPLIVDTIVQNIPMIIDGIVTAFKALVDALPTIIQSIVSALPTLIPQLINGIVSMILALVENFSAIIQPIIDALPDIIISIVQAIVDNLPAIIDGIISLVLQIVEAIPQIIQAIVDALPTVISLLIQAILNNLPKIIMGLIQVVIGIVKALPQILGSLIQAIPNALKGIWDGLGNVFGNIGNWFGEKFSGAKDAAVNAWNGAKEKFGQVWNGVKNVFSNVGNWFGDVFSGAWNGIKNAFSGAAQWASSVWENIKSAFSNVLEKFKEVGGNIVSGIWNGISNGFNWIKEKITSWVGNVLDFFKSLLGIKSPSRVFRDEVGLMITKGLAIGIEKGQTEVEKVMEEMNETLLESEQKYLDESERLKNSKSKNDKAYLEELKEIADKERKIYDALQQDIANSQKQLKESFEDLANSALDSIEEIEQAQDKFSEKLKNFGNLYNKETRKNMYGKEYEVVRLADIEEQTEILENYVEALMDVKARGDVPAEFFATLRDLSVEEGTKFAEELLRIDDDAFNDYIADWQAKQEKANELSRILYADEAEDAKKEIQKSFEKFDQDLDKMGEQNAEAWGEGFLKELQSQIPIILEKINSAFGDIIGIPSYALEGAGTVNNYTTYTERSPINLNASVVFDDREVGRMVYDSYKEEERRRG